MLPKLKCVNKETCFCNLSWKLVENSRFFERAVKSRVFSILRIQGKLCSNSCCISSVKIKLSLTFVTAA